MDSNKQRGRNVNEQRTVKNAFAVPVKKSDAHAYVTKNEPKTECTCSFPENGQNQSSQNSIKKVIKSGKKKENQNMQENTLCRDKLQNTEHEEGTDKTPRRVTAMIDTSKKGKHSEKRQNYSGTSKEKKSKQLAEVDTQVTVKSSQEINDSTDGGDSVRCHEKEEKEEETGTWVQCVKKSCHKWRYLAAVEDPVSIPEYWECALNTDQEHNSCDIPEAYYEENKYIYTKYTIGSVVWAKLDGYPWWPAMIECDPDTDMYFEVVPQSCLVPLQYHVSFFDDHVTRSWIRTRCVMPYCKGEMPKNEMSQGSLAFKNDIKAAMKNADRAVTLSLKDRINVFGFLQRFSSSKRSKPNSVRWKKNKRTKLSASGANSFIKFESPTYSHGASSKLSSKDQAGVKAAKDRKLKAEIHTSSTSEATALETLAATTSIACDNNIHADVKSRPGNLKQSNLNYVDRTDKKEHNKKRKSHKQKLISVDDGGKHIEKFIFKERNVSSNTESKESKPYQASLVVDPSGLVDTYNHDQLHSADGHKQIKKAKCADGKESPIDRHQADHLDCMKTGTVVKKKTAEEIKHKKQNNVFSLPRKMPNTDREIKQQAAANELNHGKKNKYVDDDIGKITTSTENKSKGMAMRKFVSSSDEDSAVSSTSDARNTEQILNKNVSSEKKNKNAKPSSKVPAGKTASRKEKVSAQKSKEEYGSNNSKCTSKQVVINETHRKRIRDTRSMYKKKSNPSSNITLIHNDRVYATDSPSVGVEEGVKVAHQIVPEMDTQMFDDGRASLDQAFSHLSEKDNTSGINNHLMVKVPPEKICDDDERGTHLSLDSVKVINSPPKFQKDDDSFNDSSSDSMVLNLDENERVELENTNTGKKVYEDSEEDLFFEDEYICDY